MYFKAVLTAPNVYEVALTGKFSSLSYFEGKEHFIQFDAANTGNCTINFIHEGNTIGTIQIVDNNGIALVGGEIVIDSVHAVIYDEVGKFRALTIFPEDFIQSISDTNTVDLSVVANNLTANVIHQNSTSITLSDDASGLKAVRAALTGDISAPLDSNATTLATVNANVGTFGDSTKTVTVTANGKGLITAISEQALSITGLGTALTKLDDTNVKLTLGGSPTTALVNAASITVGWSGQLSLTRGGTAANLTASLGGIFYSTAGAGAILAGTATAGQMLRSGASAAPTWSTNTFPNTTGLGEILYATSANVISSATDFIRNASGRVLIGATTELTTVGQLHIAASATFGGNVIGTFSTSTSHYGFISAIRSMSNTVGALVATADNQIFFQLQAGGVNSSSAATTSASINFVQDGAAGATFLPSRIEFHTGTSSAARASKMVITNAGEVIIGAAAVVSGELVSIQKSQNANTAFRIKNATSGTASSTSILVTDAANLSVSITSNSALFTTSGINVAATGVIFSNQTAGLNIGTNNSTQLSFWTNNTKALEISSVKNMSLGGVATRATTVGTFAFQIFDGTAPVGTLTNGVSLYSAAGVLKSMDAAGAGAAVWAGDSGAAAPATNAIGVILDYYGSSATRVLTTPNSWAAVKINGTTYKIPLYT